MERTNHTPKCLLILLAVATSLQADMSVEKWEATSKEIVLRYTAPDLNPCRVQASRVNDFGPAYQPVPDVDAALFPHSDLDSRNPALVRGQVRTFVLGQDIAEYGGVFKVTQGFVEEFGEYDRREQVLKGE